MRDDAWLKERLEQIWSLLFFDVERRNDVLIKFKGNWRNKFGHIKRLKNKNSEIAINGFFKKEIVPEYIVDVTIAHELVHYMHGFNSPHPKLFAHPHKGGVVDKELRGRGFGQNLLMERKWVKEAWPVLLKEHFKERKSSGFFRMKLW
ncbi:MAG TPA: hypothetical protein VFE88_00075 [Candidatus Nanoarchaeia archaeon]|nr:hypothetical protein [Candidatus Nanoarchaeia archaeon]